MLYDFQQIVQLFLPKCTNIFYMSDSERIKKVLEWLNMKPSAFARAIGLGKPDGIYHILNGRNGISDTMSEKILSAYPEISRAWIILGEGNMFNNQSSLNLEEPISDYNTINQKQIDMDATFLKEYFDALRRRDEQISELIRQQGELITKIPGAGLGEQGRLNEKIG